MRRIAIINQKGGVGKTTTCCNLGAALAAAGQRVLLIDLDPQAHLTLHLGVEPTGDQPTVYDLLTNHTPLDACVLPVRDNLALVPSHIDLAAAEIELVSIVGREVILREALARSAAAYDFVLIDCPPSLGVLTINGLAATDEVLIPLQPHFLALQGVGKLFETVALVRNRINRLLRVTGVIFCLYEAGTKLAIEVAADLAHFLDGHRRDDCPWADARLFGTIIRRNIKLAECPSHGRTIFDYAPQSNGAADYSALATELMAPASAAAPPAEVPPVLAMTAPQSPPAAAVIAANPPASPPPAPPVDKPPTPKPAARRAPRRVPTVKAAGRIVSGPDDVPVPDQAPPPAPPPAPAPPPVAIATAPPAAPSAPPPVEQPTPKKPARRPPRRVPAAPPAGPTANSPDDTPVAPVAEHAAPPPPPAAEPHPAPPAGDPPDSAAAPPAKPRTAARRRHVVTPIPATGPDHA